MSDRDSILRSTRESLRASALESPADPGSGTPEEEIPRARGKSPPHVLVLRGYEAGFSRSVTALNAGDLSWCLAAHSLRRRSPGRGLVASKT